MSAQTLSVSPCHLLGHDLNLRFLCLYRSEDLVGEALETLRTKHEISRDDIFLQTKCVPYFHLFSSEITNKDLSRYTSIDGQDRSKPLPYDPSAPILTQVQQSFQTSLRNLHTTRINALLLHGPLNTAEKTLEAWKAIVALKTVHKNVDLVGVSNVYDPGLLRYITEGAGGVKPDIVQNRWYEGNDWDPEVVAYCLQEGIHYELSRTAIPICDGVNFIGLLTLKCRSFWTLTGSPELFNHPSILKIV